MSKFEIAKWEDVITIKNGKNQKKVINPDGKYPIYGSGGIMGRADDYLCEEGTTIIGRKGSINNPKYVSEKFWNVDTAFGLSPKENILDKKYFYYFCTTYNFLKHNKATTLPSLTKADLLKIKIPLPPLPQQKKIANILDAADELRQNSKALVGKYDELTQSLFLDMFGDPVSNPKGWGKVELKKLCEPIKKIGKDYSHSSIKYVDISSIDNTKYLITTTTDYKLEDRPSRAQQVLNAGDILLSTVRPNLKNIAINNVEGYIASTGFYVCRTNSRLNNKYLFEVLKSDSVTNYFVGITSGANYPAIKSSDVSSFSVALPSINLQNQFEERVALIEEQKAIAQKSLDKSEELFNSLLQKAFKGELV